jgi:diguanylate cyclase (GGDEF)-like protein
MGNKLREKILRAEIFEPGMFNLGTSLEHMIVTIESLRRWKDDEVLDELRRMESEGLVVPGDYGTWRSTFERQATRERLVQSVGLRSACLSDQHLYEIQDLALAIIVAPQLKGNVHYAESDDTIRVYLHQRAEEECKSACDLLVRQGYACETAFGRPSSISYYPTSKGMRYYDEVLRARLGLINNESILDFADESKDESHDPNPGMPMRRKQDKFGVLDVRTYHYDEDYRLGIGMLGVAVIYFDLDHFKAINTRFTEPIVDRELLTDLNRLVAALVEGRGFAYAEGGDEFLILLPNTSLKIAEVFVQELLDALRVRTFIVQGDEVKVTASAGIAWSKDPKEAQSCIDAAALAKRAAKDGGRDQYRVAQGNPLGRTAG